MTMEHRKIPTPRPSSRADRPAPLGATDKPDNFSELCEQHLPYVPGWACSCTALASALSTAGKDPCAYQPFEAACPDKHAELCGPDLPERPPGGYGSGGQQAGAGTYVMYGLGAVALGAAGAYVMDDE